MLDIMAGLALTGHEGNPTSMNRVENICGSVIVIFIALFKRSVIIHVESKKCNGRPAKGELD